MRFVMFFGCLPKFISSFLRSLQDVNFRVVSAFVHIVPSIAPMDILEQCNEQHYATINTTDHTVVLKWDD